MALYFRIKDNGATVFRVEDESRQRRLDLAPVAEANHRNGEIKPRKQVELTGEERREIEVWLAARRTTLARREAEEAALTVERINAAANWIGGKPDPEAAAAAADDLLMAIHDLRGAIVRWKARAMDADED